MNLNNHHLQSLLAVRPLERLYAGCRADAERRSVIVRQLLPGLPKTQVDETAAVFVRHMERLSALTERAALPVREFTDGGDGVLFYITDEPSGLSFLEFIDRSGPLKSGEAAAIGLNVANCLSHAHALDVCHLGLNSRSVLLERTGEVMLLDLGLRPLLIELVSDRLRNVNSAWSHLFPEPGVVAPELIVGDDVSKATDVYGLGALLFLLATGRAPYTGSSVVAYNSIVSGSIEPDPRQVLADIAPAYADLVRRCLHRNCVERPSLQVVIEELEALALPINDVIEMHGGTLKCPGYIDGFEPLLTLVDGGPGTVVPVPQNTSQAVVPLFEPEQVITDAEILKRMSPEQRRIYLRELLSDDRQGPSRQFWTTALLIISALVILFFAQFMATPAMQQQSSTITTNDSAAPLERRIEPVVEVRRERHPTVLYLRGESP